MGEITRMGLLQNIILMVMQKTPAKKENIAFSKWLSLYRWEKLGQGFELVDGGGMIRKSPWFNIFEPDGLTPVELDFVILPNRHGILSYTENG